MCLRVPLLSYWNYECICKFYQNGPYCGKELFVKIWVNNNITSLGLIKSLELEIWNFILKIFFTSRIGKMYNSVASTFIIFSLCRPTPSQKSPTLICSFYLRDILTPKTYNSWHMTKWMRLIKPNNQCLK